MDMERLEAFVSQKVERCKILVAGDVMLDKYYYGKVTRISPEAPVPINHVSREKETLGGAANVAHNLALLGCKTMLAGFVGDDFHYRSLAEKLSDRGILSDSLVMTDRPTTTKIRVIGGHQQMIRLDFEDARPLEERWTDQFLEKVKKRLDEGMDAMILSDYAKGTLSDRSARALIAEAHAHGVPVIVDPKGTNWTKYKKCDYITPNLKEINEILIDPISNTDAEIVKACHYISRKYDIKNVLATRSEKGVSLVREGQEVHIPTRSQEVFDVSGAGDTVIAVLAAGLSGGLRGEEAAYLANLAASVVVAKLGTYAVAREELSDALHKVGGIQQ
ncbi:hypothetical protein TAMA11512_18150 [Selenomonas sp. TAMA-11512]|uniref:D-glycero-beta-D-manno-heptose-7-phosphate kinase n=1 Tax=Selenomonas sp. TAMA-11512 TaxID=3095337 RepID=UPI00308A551E|nr:hypothetical protein TAMA11512_18150 [Selenomonas sp. TAMA-11512]